MPSCIGPVTHYASPVTTRIRSTIGLELVIRVVFGAFPAGLRRLLAGPPIRVDGQTLDPDLQLLLRLERLTDAGTPSSTPERRREHLDIASALVGGPLVDGVSTRDIDIPSEARPDAPGLTRAPVHP